MIRNVQLYSGPIHRLAVNSISLKKDKVVTEVKSDLIQEDALYYTSFLGKYISMEYGTVLADLEEAKTFIDDYVKSHEGSIYNFLNNPELSDTDKEELSDLLKCSSAILYHNPEEIKLSQKISRKEFKDLKIKKMKRD